MITSAKKYNESILHVEEEGRKLRRLGRQTGGDIAVEWRLSKSYSITRGGGSVLLEPCRFNCQSELFGMRHKNGPKKQECYILSAVLGTQAHLSALFMQAFYHVAKNVGFMATVKRN